MFALRQSCNCDVVSSAEKATERSKTKLALYTLSWMHKQLQQSLVVVMHEGKSNKRATFKCCCCEFESDQLVWKTFTFYLHTWLAEMLQLVVEAANKIYMYALSQLGSPSCRWIINRHEWKTLHTVVLRLAAGWEDLHRFNTHRTVEGQCVTKI